MVIWWFDLLAVLLHNRQDLLGGCRLADIKLQTSFFLLNIFLGISASLEANDVWQEEEFSSRMKLKKVVYVPD